MSQATWCIARAVAASLARNAGDIMRPTRFLSWRDPASRMQSRIRWTAHLCQEAPWNTSSTALTRPLCASEVTSCTPWTPRPLMRRRNPSHESYDSVSTTDRPSTRRQPPSSQPIAVTTAVEATRPSRRHLT